VQTRNGPWPPGAGPVQFDIARSFRSSSSSSFTGYAELLKALADPDNEGHEHLASRVRGEFDPTLFDLGAVNVALQPLR